MTNEHMALASWAKQIIITLLIIFTEECLIVKSNKISDMLKGCT
jgi:hypothetical protein